MLETGLAVAIGTDSAASHFPDEAQPLSVLDELRSLHRNHPGIPAQTLLAMATVHGAAALGLSQSIGKIAPGFLADMIAFDLSPEMTNDPAEAVVRMTQRPAAVLIAGNSRVYTSVAFMTLRRVLMFCKPRHRRGNLRQSQKRCAFGPGAVYRIRNHLPGSLLMPII